MGIPNLTILCQVCAFVLSFVLSFFILIPMAINQRNFGGQCLLYATGEWNTTSNTLTEVHWGPNSACGFSLFIGIVLLMLTLFYIVIDSLHLLQETESSWLDAALSSLISFVITIMLFAECLTISVGFSKWCDLLVNPPSQIVSCDLADYIVFDTKDNIDSTSFYTHIKIAEVASWMSLVCWVFLLVTSVVKVIKFQKHETFMTSVNRERQRLLQKVKRRSEYTQIAT